MVGRRVALAQARQATSVPGSAEERESRAHPAGVRARTVSTTPARTVRPRRMDPALARARVPLGVIHAV